MIKSLSYIELSKRNLLHNIRCFRTLIPRDAILVAVVKANAYGHGLGEIVTATKKHIDAFQVDDIEELREIRRYTNKRVLVFGHVMKTDLEEATSLGAVFGVYDKEILKQINRIGKKKKKNIEVHLKIDALLGRQGILLSEVAEYAALIKNLSFVRLGAVYAHFSNIEDTKNLSHAKRQQKQLLQAKEILHGSGFLTVIYHISSTAGLLSDVRTNWGGAYVRLGVGMYGHWPSQHLEKSFSKKIVLKPVMRWVSHLAQVKTIPAGYPVGYGLTFVSKKRMVIGIVPQGYSDGYDRGFSNNGEVLVRGICCPVIGRVAMNMFAIDVSKVRSAAVCDEVVLMGSQRAKEITVEAMAQRLNTINYEILARISQKLPRVVI